MEIQKCLHCGERPVTIVADSYGQGFCSHRCRKQVLHELTLVTYEEALQELKRLREVGAI